MFPFRCVKHFLELLHGPRETDGEDDADDEKRYCNPQVPYGRCGYRGDAKDTGEERDGQEESSYNREKPCIITVRWVVVSIAHCSGLYFTYACELFSILNSSSIRLENLSLRVSR